MSPLYDLKPYKFVNQLLLIYVSRLLGSKIIFLSSLYRQLWDEFKKKMVKDGCLWICERSDICVQDVVRGCKMRYIYIYQLDIEIIYYRRGMMTSSKKLP